MRKPIAERFWAKVFKHDGHDACWEWLGARSSSGYGHIGSGGSGGRMIRAHRLSWELHHGEIPGALQVLHNCPAGDNPLCVRPDHLWVGTHQQNMADKWAKGRGNLNGAAACAAHWRAKAHCPMGHPYFGGNLYVHPITGWRTCRACDRFRHRKTRAVAAGRER